VRILLIDDERQLLRLMSVYLERLGHSVATTSSTEEAMAAFDRAPSEYEVAVVDATMPGPPIGELVRRFLGAAPALRVIITSGYPIDTAGFEAEAPGRVASLPKPFTSEMLASLVEGMLAP